MLHLPKRLSSTAGTMRKLRDEQVVKLMFPTFDEEKRALPEGATSCTGVTIFDDPLFRGGTPASNKAWPFVVQDGDITYGSGGDRLKLAWLHTHANADGTMSGPLAVIRSGEQFAELFAMGVHRGPAERTRLGTARMGGDYLVTVEDDGCTGRQRGASCETTLSVAQPRRGRLVPLVKFPLERVAYSGKGERGSLGVLEYRLTSVPEFRDDRIEIVEQIRVQDDTGRELRKAEHQRTVTMNDKGEATANEPSLWDEMFKPDDTAQAHQKKR